MVSEQCEWLSQIEGVVPEKPYADCQHDKGAPREMQVVPRVLQQDESPYKARHRHKEQPAVMPD